MRFFPKYLPSKKVTNAPKKHPMKLTNCPTHRPYRNPEAKVSGVAGNTGC